MVIHIIIINNNPIHMLLFFPTTVFEAKTKISKKCLAPQNGSSRKLITLEMRTFSQTYQGKPTSKEYTHLEAKFIFKEESTYYFCPKF